MDAGGNNFKAIAHHKHSCCKFHCANFVAISLVARLIDASCDESDFANPATSSLSGLCSCGQLPFFVRRCPRLLGAKQEFITSDATPRKIRSLTRDPELDMEEEEELSDTNLKEFCHNFGWDTSLVVLKVCAIAFIFSNLHESG